MFSYSGLTKEQMVRLRNEFGVYGIDSGRICVAALNSKNIDYVAAVDRQGGPVSAVNPARRRHRRRPGRPDGRRGAGAGRRAVDLFDAMPSVGRKFLLAGRGGLNLTHSEPPDALLARYGARSDAWRDRAGRLRRRRGARNGPPAWASRPSSAPPAACSPPT
jgi:hypothetical protein